MLKCYDPGEDGQTAEFEVCTQGLAVSYEVQPGVKHCRAYILSTTQVGNRKFLAEPFQDYPYFVLCTDP
jgi:hypothetical protein